MNNISSTVGNRIAIEALDWIGVPFLFRGFTKFGCDCTGLLVGILKNLNLCNFMVQEYLLHRERGAKYIDGAKILNVLCSDNIDTPGKYIQSSYAQNTLTRSIKPYVGSVWKVIEDKIIFPEMYYCLPVKMFIIV